MDRQQNKASVSAGAKSPVLAAARRIHASTAAQVFVLLLAGFFLAFGIMRGEVAEVLKKAVKICLECIGIG